MTAHDQSYDGDKKNSDNDCNDDLGSGENGNDEVANDIDDGDGDNVSSGDTDGCCNLNIYHTYTGSYGGCLLTCFGEVIVS